MSVNVAIKSLHALLLLLLTFSAGSRVAMADDAARTLYMDNRIAGGLSMPAAPAKMPVAQAMARAAAAPGGGNTAGYVPTYDHLLDRLPTQPGTTPETTDLIGEQIDLNGGALSFRQTDLSLPGNSALEVAIHRKFQGVRYATNSFEFADWQLDLPMIQNTILRNNVPRYSGGWSTGQECMQNRPGPIYNAPDNIEESDYWNGTQLNIPGAGSQMLLQTGETYTTQSHWKIHCITRADGQGQGYQAISPTGVKYTFDVPRLIQMKGFVKTRLTARFYAQMLVSRIEDRFGNYVVYRYHGTQLHSIEANDGRNITLTYHGGTGPFKNYVSAVSGAGKTWHYNYLPATSQVQNSLHQVVRPDHKSWLFSLAEINALGQPAVPTRELSTGCERSMAASRTATITHPHGMVATFTLAPRVFGRTEVPKWYKDMKNYYAVQPCYNQYSLITKQLSGPAVQTLSWHYSYSENHGAFVGAAKPVPNAHLTPPSAMDAGDLRSTRVVAPDGSVTLHYHSRRFDFTEGAEVLTEYYDKDAATLLKRIEKSYARGPMLGAAAMFDANSESTDHARYLVSVHTTLQQTKYSTNFSDFTPYGSAQLTHEFNNFSTQAKYTKRTFLTDPNLWLLDLPLTTQVSADNTSYTTVAATSYYPATSAYPLLPYQYKSFGQLQQTVDSYHTTAGSKGLPARITLHQKNSWQAFADYKAGQPQVITVPDRYHTTPVSMSRSINDDGTVAAVTDFNGHHTKYHYDALGRLSTVDIGDANFSDTAISYQDIAPHLGALQQLTVRGDYRKLVTLDALMRPIFTEEWDANSQIRRYVNQQFNSYNNPTFVSVPSASATESFGSHTTYDGLQRPVSVTNTAQGLLSYSYDGGHNISVTNGKGYSTHTSFLAYGSPATSEPVSISQPESVTTLLSYNLFGHVTQIQQGGQYETRHYNSAQQLCLIKRADTGIKVFSYNSLGQLSSFAEGVSGLGRTCTDYSAFSSSIITLAYDNRGEQHNIRYADGSPAVTYTYDASGNLLALANGHSTWSYHYNSQHQLTAETLTIDGKTFAITSGYNSLGHLSSRTYGGATLSYLPDAFGQPTQVKEASTVYASNIQYHPNGQLSSFTYGNGLSFSQTLNAEYLPQTRQISKAAAMQLGQQYVYDQHQNVDKITDLVNSQRSLTLSYDGLDRLSSANGSWGNGSFSYDPLGNIKTKHLGAQTLNYQYNSNNLLLSIPGHYQFIYDDRGNVIHNGQRSFNFNRANQLISSGTASYRYDGHNRRVHKSGNTRGYSVYNVAGQLLLTESEQGQVRYIHLGNTLLAKAGMVHTPQDTPGYTGHLTDQDLSLTYMQQRYYDPVIGRFYSNDPVGFSAKEPMLFNRYTYANNNPYKFVDPDGRQVEVVARPLKLAAMGGVGAHTYTRVTKSDGTKTVFSSHNVDGKNVVSKNHPTDTSPHFDSGSTTIAPPDGMTQDQFDNSVLEQGEKMIANDSLDYAAFPSADNPSEGNCHTTTRNLIDGSGGKIPEKFDPKGMNPDLHGDRKVEDN
jgi:RHS repeat-associated protein